MCVKGPTSHFIVPKGKLICSLSIHRETKPKKTDAHTHKAQREQPKFYHQRSTMCNSDGNNTYGLVLLTMIVAGTKDTLCLHCRHFILSTQGKQLKIIKERMVWTQKDRGCLPQHLPVIKVHKLDLRLPWNLTSQFNQITRLIVQRHNKIKRLNLSISLKSTVVVEPLSL